MQLNHGDPETLPIAEPSDRWPSNLRGGIAGRMAMHSWRIVRYIRAPEHLEWLAGPPASDQTAFGQFYQRQVMYSNDGYSFPEGL